MVGATAIKVADDRLIHDFLAVFIVDSSAFVHCPEDTTFWRFRMEYVTVTGAISNIVLREGEAFTFAAHSGCRLTHP